MNEDLWSSWNRRRLLCRPLVVPVGGPCPWKGTSPALRAELVQGQAVLSAGRGPSCGDAVPVQLGGGHALLCPRHSTVSEPGLLVRTSGKSDSASGPGFAGCGLEDPEPVCSEARSPRKVHSVGSAGPGLGKGAEEGAR